METMQDKGGGVSKGGGNGKGGGGKREETRAAIPPVLI